MTQEPTESVAEPHTEPQDESVRQVFSRLYADGRAYAEAEVNRQKLRAGLVSGGVRDAAIFAVAGAMLLFATVVACFVGIILLLSPHLGAGWATLAVLGGGVIVTLILLLLAKGRIDRMKRAIQS